MYVSHSATNPIADVVANLAYTDQYGVAMSSVTPSVIVTNLNTANTVTVASNNSASPTFSGTLAAGDPFNVTVATSNGLNYTVKVVLS